MYLIKNIEVFGDSILKGIQVNSNSLKYHVENHIDTEAISGRYSVSIVNNSKFGCTVTKGLSILKKRLEHGISFDAAIMDFGGNDCDMDWRAISDNPYQEHLPKTTIHVFISTYKELVSLLQNNGVLPILTTLPPLEPQRFFDWFCGKLNKENILKWLGDVIAIYRHQENYSRAIERIALDCNVPIVDLRGAFLQHRRIKHLLCEDGTHPNTEGQKVITDAFLTFAENVAHTPSIR